VIQVLKPEPQIMRYELSDYEWSVIKPMLPNKPRGVPRVDDRRVDEE
jgi:transposase